MEWTDLFALFSKLVGIDFTVTTLIGNYSRGGSDVLGQPDRESRPHLRREEQSFI